MKPIRNILLSFLLFGVGMPCGAQEVVNRMLGTDFWMMFLKQHELSVEGGMAIDCFFVLTATEESDVTISYGATGWDTLVTVPAGGAVRVSVPDDQSTPYHFGAKIDSNAWHIQATTPISVTAYNDIDHSYDATAILPTDALRTYYITQVYQAFPHGPEVGIVAPYDSTRVWSVLEKNICSDTGFLDRVIFHAGDTIEFLLMRGQTCLLRNAGWTAAQVTWISECSLNGLRLHSDKPIAVFQGNNAAYMPQGGDSQAPDHLYDQCIPVEYWGTHFAIEPVIGRQPYSMGYPPRIYHNYGDIVRVMAKDDNCRISLDGQEVAVLQRGQIYQFVLSDHPASLPASWGMDFYQSPCIELTSTSPVMVCYYITGSLFGGHPGDPAVMTMPPIENGVNHAIIQPHNTPISTQHWINIVTQSEYLSQITLDGTNIGSQFHNTAGGYSYACIPVSEATHTIDAAGGIFIAYLYGLGYCESYLHTAASTTENKPYNVWTQRYEACEGDSITVGITRFDGSLSASWYIDGVWAADAVDSLSVVFNSTGNHQIMTVISPIGDTVYTYITVGSYHTSHSTATICSGGSYTWRGQELTAGGNYGDTISAAGGCDTILRLHLNVNPPPVTTTYDTVCQGGTYLWRGRILNAEGSYADTITRADGCDSVLMLSLNVTSPPLITTYDTICQDATYLWHGRILNAEGSYVDTITHAGGCDSILVLNLNVTPPPLITTYDTICQGGTYLWHGRALNAAGSYADTITHAGGCDTLLALHLFLRPKPETAVSDSFCTGDVYEWHNHTFAAAGTYIDTLRGRNGCDTIATLHLSALVTPQISLTVIEDCNRKEYSVLSIVDPDDEVLPYWISLPPDSTLDGQQWDSIVVTPTAATLYILAFDGRCPNDTSILLTPSEWPHAAMEVHPSILNLDNLLLVAQDVSLNANERTWYVDDVIAGHASTLYYTASAAADSVWLTLVANRGGCADTAYATIPVTHSVIWAPNAFTPGGDNNQRFIIKGNEVTLIDLYIYTRNGVLAWHSDNPSEGWNGTLKDGTPCPQASYTWILHYTQKDQPKITKKAVGTVTLLR